MKPSKFQMKDFRLLELNYLVNSEFEFNGEVPLNITANVTTKKAENMAVVALTLNAFLDKELSEVPFKFKTVIEGQFVWGKELSEDLINSLLKTNAPALLMSYIRPFVTQFTSYSGFPPLILPLMDFSKKEKVEKTTDKVN